MSYILRPRQLEAVNKIYEFILNSKRFLFNEDYMLNKKELIKEFVKINYNICLK